MNLLIMYYFHPSVNSVNFLCLRGIYWHILTYIPRLTRTAAIVVVSRDTFNMDVHLLLVSVQNLSLINLIKQTNYFKCVSLWVSIRLVKSSQHTCSLKTFLRRIINNEVLTTVKMSIYTQKATRLYNSEDKYRPQNVSLTIIF
jgi:hypothetical protein